MISALNHLILCFQRIFGQGYKVLKRDASPKHSKMLNKSLEQTKYKTKKRLGTCSCFYFFYALRIRPISFHSTKTQNNF